MSACAVVCSAVVGEVFGLYEKATNSNKLKNLWKLFGSCTQQLKCITLSSDWISSVDIDYKS